MKIHKNLIYTGSGARKSPFDLYLTDNPATTPLVVFVHGYKGFKDWGAWQLVAENWGEELLRDLPMRQDDLPALGRIEPVRVLDVGIGGAQERHSAVPDQHADP